MAKKKIFQISNALTEGIEETISAANHFSGELRVDVIPIKRIEVDPSNPRDFALTLDDIHLGIVSDDPFYLRKTDELASLQSLANSIRTQGIINPVVVYKYGDKYRLIAGERRTLASVLAGKQEIQAKILEGKPNPLKISLLQWIENIERTDLSLWERLTNLEKIIKAYGDKELRTIDSISITELANILGCTKPHAMNYKLVLMATEDLKTCIRENKIRNLEKAAYLASLPETELRQAAIEACIQGASLKKLKAITQDKKAKKHLIAHLSRRGRHTISVNLGTTKNLKVAKAILNILLKNEELSYLGSYFQTVEWNDYQSVNQSFKFLITKLEELHA